MLKIATWNVNSVGVRIERLLAFLAREKPDAVCLQELKCTDDKFPFEALANAGYVATVFGQKAYNGVAVLTRGQPVSQFRNFGQNNDDDAARFAGVEIRVQRPSRLPPSARDTVWIASAYCPNGQAPGTEKFAYKLDWFKRLRSWLDTKHVPAQALVVAGDFNIAPTDLDVYDPSALREKIHTSTPEREALQRVLDFGLIDTFRQHNQSAGQYSWWDYRELSFQANRGLRIDMIYATLPLANLCTGSEIDRNERKGERPSDHVPVIATFDLIPKF